MALALALTEEGDLDVRNGPRLVSGAEAARGALYYRFTTFSGTSRQNPGEWPYDYTYGIPYRDAVFGRYFQLDEIQAILADQATSTVGVGQVSPGQVSITTDPNTRKAVVQIVNVRTDGDGFIDSILLPSEDF